MAKRTRADVLCKVWRINPGVRDLSRLRETGEVETTDAGVSKS